MDMLSGGTRALEDEEDHTSQADYGNSESAMGVARKVRARGSTTSLDRH